MVSFLFKISTCTSFSVFSCSVLYPMLSNKVCCFGFLFLKQNTSYKIEIHRGVQIPLQITRASEAVDRNKRAILITKVHFVKFKNPYRYESNKMSGFPYRPHPNHKKK